MKYSTIAVFILFSLFLYTKSQTQSCSGDSSCNLVRTFQLKVCDNNVCKDRTAVNFNEVPTGDVYCKDSFNLGVRCGQYLANGCPRDILKLEERCLSGRVENGKCAAPATSNATYVNVNQKCDNTDLLCRRNQVCVNGVCRLRLKVGQLCDNSELSCMTGLTCDYGICSKRYWKRDGAPCSTSAVCKSGRCESDHCVPQTGYQCYSNNDCRGRGYCKKSSKEATANEPGRCYSPSRLWSQKYQQCYYNYCSQKALTGDEWTKCLKDNCEKERIRNICGSNCLSNRVDQRATSNQETYDCLAVTAKALTNSDCAIKKQFSNCDAVVDYNGAIGKSTSFGLLLVVILLIAIFQN